MSGRLCCYKQQQHSKLLAQFVFKVSAFRFNTRMKTRAPLPDCRINNALIQFVTSCQDTRTQFVDVLDQPFSDIAAACSIISCLVVGIFMPKKHHSNKVLPFAHRVFYFILFFCRHSVNKVVYINESYFWILMYRGLELWTACGADKYIGERMNESRV